MFCLGNVHIDFFNFKSVEIIYTQTFHCFGRACLCVILYEKSLTERTLNIVLSIGAHWHEYYPIHAYDTSKHSAGHAARS